jgi:flagellin-like protein
MSKKAEMGVGTLIIFIAMLLVAAVAAGVLIQTAGTLQEKALTTGQQAKAQISTNARIIEVSASNGQNGTLTDFQEILKLAPGSDPIKLDQIIFTFNTKDQTSTLKYKGTTGICAKDNANGYNTWNEEELGYLNTSVDMYTLDEDLDDDGMDDHAYLTSSAAVNASIVFELSTAGLISVPLGVNLSNASGSSKVISLATTNVARDGITYATVLVSGTSNVNNSIPASVTVALTPYNEGEGYFTAIYEQQGTNNVAGNLQRGDIVRFCFESPGQIAEDEEVRLNFIPKVGTATLTQFVTPDVITTERVYLYP